MNSKPFAACASGLVLSIAPLLLVTACAAAKPSLARAPSTPTIATATPPTGPTSVTPANPEPSRGMIAISDEIRTVCRIPAEDASFAFDSATIESSDLQPLDDVARCFSSGPLAGRSMRLVGHADPRGPSEYNMALGQRRADSVEGYIDRRGVRPAQIATTSRGALDATGQDESGWAHDRRVDVQLGS